jgi:hypothetical protein
LLYFPHIAFISERKWIYLVSFSYECYEDDHEKACLSFSFPVASRSVGH